MNALQNDVATLKNAVRHLFNELDKFKHAI